MFEKIQLICNKTSCKNDAIYSIWGPFKAKYFIWKVGFVYLFSVKHKDKLVKADINSILMQGNFMSVKQFCMNIKKVFGPAHAITKQLLLC